MSTSARRILLILAVIGVGLLAICEPWAKFLYHGDGTFSDLTVLNHPRYLIRFNEIPMFQTGSYQYHFGGLPHEQMTLALHVKAKTPLRDGELKSLHTVIEAVLVDSHGTDVCKPARLRSRTLPALNQPDSVWVLSGTAQDPVFWNWQCHNFEVRTRESYELTMRVTQADANDDELFVTPTLEGGGIEFP